MLNVINVVIMGVLCAYMVKKAQFRTARRMALIPLGICLTDVLAFGLLKAELFPVLTLILAALRLTVVLCCNVALRRDAAMVRARARRLRRQRQTVPTQVVSAPRTPAAAARCA